MFHEYWFLSGFSKDFAPEMVAVLLIRLLVVYCHYKLLTKLLVISISKRMLKKLSKTKE